MTREATIREQIIRQIVTLLTNAGIRITPNWRDSHGGRQEYAICADDRSLVYVGYMVFESFTCLINIPQAHDHCPIDLHDPHALSLIAADIKSIVPADRFDRLVIAIQQV